MGTLCPAAQYSSPLGFSCPTPAQLFRRHRQRKEDPSSQNAPGRPSLSRRKFGIDNASNFCVRNLGASDQAEYHTTCSQIALWLRNLLGNTTTSNDGTTTVGTAYTSQRILGRNTGKSLISLCARQVPECIADIQAWDREQAEKNGRGLWAEWKESNASTSMYEELQDVYGDQETGWCHFKTLVRAHAIRMLVEAINDSLFTQSFVLTLVQVCHEMSNHEEAACLLRSIPTTCAKTEDNTDLSASELLFQCWAENQGDTPISSFIFGAWETLLLQKRISIHDLAARRPSKPQSRTSDTMWDDCLRCVTQPAYDPQAVSFLRLALSLLATDDGNGEQTGQPARLRRLVSICAGLVSAMFTDEASPQYQRRVLSILDMAIAECLSASPHRPNVENSGIFLLTLARQMALHSVSSSYPALVEQGATELQEIIAQSDTTNAYRHTVLLVASTAQARCRSQQVAGQQALADVYSSVRALPLPCWFHKGLLADAAFVLAQKSRNLRDLAFAESFKHTQEKDTQEKGNFQDSMFSGWVWDAGISEWILPESSRRKELALTRSQGLSTSTLEDDLAVATEPSPEDESWLSTESSLSEGPTSPELPPLATVTGMWKADKARRLGAHRSLMRKATLSGTKHVRKLPREPRFRRTGARILWSSPCSSPGFRVSAASGRGAYERGAVDSERQATPTKVSKLLYSTARDAEPERKKRNMISRPTESTTPNSAQRTMVVNRCVRVRSGSTGKTAQAAASTAQVLQVSVPVCELETGRGPCSNQACTTKAKVRRIVRTVSLSSLSGRRRSGAQTVDDDDWDELG